MEPFVGRATELAELQSELDLVRRSGRARFVWMRGRRRVGKSEGSIGALAKIGHRGEISELDLASPADANLEEALIERQDFVGRLRLKADTGRSRR
jgi:hypothetical protein